MSKYHSKKTVVDGIVFDSLKEARRYGVLKALEKTGEISGLRRQVEFLLIQELQREIHGLATSLMMLCSHSHKAAKAHLP